MDGIDMPRLGLGTWPITDSAHLRANFDARDLTIDDDDVERIDSLHEWHQQRVNNPDNPAWK